MKVTLWKLGDFEYKFYPSDKAVSKLTRILKKAYKNKTEHLDLIWGPDLKIEQYETSANEIVKGDIHIRREFESKELFPVKDGVNE